MFNDDWKDNFIKVFVDDLNIHNYDCINHMEHL
jgi:hypothetical protein